MSYDWLTAIVNKRPETALVMHQLLLAAREKGCCTAEDAHNINVSHPNVRGAAMKLLGKCGMVKVKPVRGSTKQSHGHWLWQWGISDYNKLEDVLRCIGRMTMQMAEPVSDQYRLNI